MSFTLSEGSIVTIIIFVLGYVIVGGSILVKLYMKVEKNATEQKVTSRSVSRVIKCLREIKDELAKSNTNYAILTTKFQDHCKDDDAFHQEVRDSLNRIENNAT